MKKYRVKAVVPKPADEPPVDAHYFYADTQEEVAAMIETLKRELDGHVIGTYVYIETSLGHIRIA